MEEDIIDEFGEENGKDVVYAGFWIRVGAAIIDSLVLLPIASIEIFNKTNLDSYSVLFVTTALSMLYKPYLEFKGGATIGKKALGLRVVNEEYEGITMDQSVLRSMPWLIQSLIATMVSIQYYQGDERVSSFLDLATLQQEGYWIELNAMYSFVFIVIILVVIFDKQKQGLHDKIAKTYCIKES